jgi:hypothetical protein
MYDDFRELNTSQATSGADCLKGYTIQAGTGGEQAEHSRAHFALPAKPSPQEIRTTMFLTGDE